ncbi:MAG: LptF/LptG family permease [Paludibacteraceae bacterium]|nr:LptF/LptG family permease [Paludibacteraceae bacterium]
MLRLPVKRLDMYMLRNFLGLFVLTLVICIFILLMQFVWLHVRDLVGKGVELSVLAEFFIYAVASVVPLALPLAVLLSSLMTFGNLGEQVELTAMKAAGVSLFRIIRPLVIAVMVICVGAFYFSNSVLPVSQVKLWTLIFSLRQKSPELDIPEGEFYDGISGYHIYVRHKAPKRGMLYDMMIYDYSKGFKDATVMLADSGKIVVSDDKHYLMLHLYSGESFENLSRKQQRATGTTKNIPYRRETFAEKQILIDFDSDLTRYDESLLADQHVSKDTRQLLHSIDSVHALSVEKGSEQSQQMIESRYLGRERHTAIANEQMNAERAQRIAEAKAKGVDWLDKYDPDSLFASLSNNEKERVLSIAIERARAQRDQIDYNAIVLDDYQRYIRKHEVELHRKFTLAFACLIFFFIGAPLGAIIRKGGLGTPVIISVVMFIFYYIIDNTGYKMAREALWPCWAGMWLSSFVLLPIGIFLTYKAATDSSLFNPEAWAKWLEPIKKKFGITDDN